MRHTRKLGRLRTEKKCPRVRASVWSNPISGIPNTGKIMKQLLPEPPDED